MMKKILTMITLTLFLSLLIPFFQNNSIHAQSLNLQTIDDPTKTWTISFNDAVGADAQNLQKIYVQSANLIKHQVSIKISADSKKVTVKPKNPYLFGNTYTLVIPKDFQSAKGSKTKVEVTKEFKVEGKVISEITAVANPLLTNIIVKGTKDVMKITYAMNGNEEQALIPNNAQFSKGQQGLVLGDLLTIYAYDKANNLIETQYYEVK